MWKHFAVATVIVAAGCNHATLDRDIIGVWESAGTPNSSALPESMRKSSEWSAEIAFGADGRFKWELDAADGGRIRLGGTYKVVGYSLDVVVTDAEGKALPTDDRLSYTVRQQSTGAIRLPLPQDWTGPSVDYFKKP